MRKGATTGDVMKRKKIYQRGQAQASGSWSVFEWSNSYFTSKNEAFQYDAQVAGDRPNGYYGSFRSVDAVEINGQLFKLTPIKAKQDLICVKFFFWLCVMKV